MKIKFLFLPVFALFVSCSTIKQEIPEVNVKNAIEAADIHRTEYVDGPALPLNQGNGRFGTSYSQLGLHLSPSRPESDFKYGRTHLMHIEHFGRAQYGSDYLLPLASIYWADPITDVANYHQFQSFYDGTLKTAFSTGNTQIEVLSWFDTYDKDLSVLRINVKGQTAPSIMIESEETLHLHYSQTVPQTVNITQEGDVWNVSLQCLGKDFHFYVQTNAAVEIKGGKLLLTLKEGQNDLRISYKAPSQTDPDQSLKQTIDWWHKKWEETAVIRFPDFESQCMWVRSMALFLSTYSSDKLGLAPPCGFAGNSWPFPYPQDVSYIHPVLLQTGNTDIAKSWIEYFAERIDGMKRYTQRLLKVDGILSPWVFPYGDFEGYHDPTPPNKFYYEIHNTGYMARMAYEASIFVNDEAWTKQYAYPLIAECARFYRSIATKGTDGYWHLFVEPGMGQDERGGVNQKDYLCALYGAKYCFQKAVECHLDEQGEYAQILEDGLAFAPLKSQQGFLYSCAGSGPNDFGHQKHPVQLNELAYLPTEQRPTAEALIAYELRYDITRDAQKPYFYGWTLGEFLLAGSRVGNVDGWQKDWDNMLTSDYVDKDFIQIFETSQTYNVSFYNTTNGLIAQTLYNNLLCDWYGTLEIGKCFPWKENVVFRNLYSKLGVKVSGSIGKEKAHLLLEAWKDCDFMMGKKHIVLKKGEKKTIKK